MLALLLSNSNMDKNEMKFPWSLLFFVTGISLIAFSFAIKLLEGNHSKIMLKAGAAALCAGVLSSVIKMLSSYLYNKRKNSKENF